MHITSQIRAMFIFTTLTEVVLSGHSIFWLHYANIILNWNKYLSALCSGECVGFLSTKRIRDKNTFFKYRKNVTIHHHPFKSVTD